MAKDLCVVHANCQGEALIPLLRASPAFERLFDVRFFVNFTGDRAVLERLSDAKLYLYQYLGHKWGDLASDNALTALASGARAVCVPNFFFNGYWPYWSNETNVIEFEDAALEKLLARGLPPEAAQALYLRGDDAVLGDARSAMERVLAREREKESFTPIKYVDFIEERWRDEQLFLTVNHPGKTLLIAAANATLRLLDLPPLSESVAELYNHPQGEFWLPIHPALKKIFGLKFASRERKYPCFGAEITHEEYIQYYLACRMHGIRDLTGVLRDRAERR